MDYPCSNTLMSEDYTEFIIRQGVLNRKSLESLEDYCLTPLNDQWAIVSVRTDAIRELNYENLVYSAFPLPYALSDLEALSASGVTAVREQPALALYGQGVYLAVLDTGINWRHEAFRNSDGSTRIAVYWDQEEDVVYEREQINRALTENGAKKPPEDLLGHGTALAGIAAGSCFYEKGFCGVAPYAELIVVRVKPMKPFLREFYRISEDTPAYAESDLMRAVQFATDYADEKLRPVSFCIGMGTSLGNHSGSSPLAMMLANEAGRIGRCVSVASGNEGNARLHYSGNLSSRESEQIEIRAGKNETGFVCNLWAMPSEIFSVELVSPSGQNTGKIASRNERNTTYRFLYEGTEVSVYYEQYEGLSGANLIAFRFVDPLEGIWKIKVYPERVSDGRFEFWMINRAFLSGDTYLLQSDPDMTVTDPANQPNCIAVSAYDSRANTFYLENSRGYNFFGFVRPDFTAPGVEITVPSQIGEDTYSVKTGSSVAAAFFSGIASLLLEYGIVKGNIPYLRTSQIKSLTIASCMQKEGLIYPNREWGFGTVNIYEAFEQLRRTL